MMKSSQGHLRKIDSSPTMNLAKMLCHVTGTMACHQKIRQRTYIDSCHWTDHLQRKRLPKAWQVGNGREKDLGPNHVTGEIFTQHFPVLRIVTSPFFQKNPPVKTVPPRPSTSTDDRSSTKPTSSPPRWKSTFKWEKYRSIVSQWYDSGPIIATSNTSFAPHMVV